jgi:hypothetical protein
MLMQLVVVGCWRWVDTIQVQLDTLEAVGLRQAERALQATESVSSMKHVVRRKKNVPKCRKFVWLLLTCSRGLL